jgi:hypothetical protein
MQRMNVLILSATIAMVSAPTLAHADGYINPFIGAQRTRFPQRRR